MAALDTVGAYITEARRLLQDKVTPYRYSDNDIIGALNLAVLEARRLRPEVFLGSSFVLPSFTSSADVIPMDPMVRTAFLYYVIGMVGLSDQEEAQDQRNGQFLNKFIGQLLSGSA